MKVVEIFQSIGDNYQNVSVDTTTILSVLLVVLLLSIYEFIVYRYVSHRSFYNRSFNITITILPFFISTIILCLQSNIVITLGTIGALAIIRFRTAVKDPVDMLYILWSIYIGIICGCQLYEVAVLTSLIVTVLLIILQNISFGKAPFILIIHTKDSGEDKIESIIQKNSKDYRIKSRSYTSNGVDFAIELSTKDIKKLKNELKQSKDVEKFSIIKYDAEDII
ncbi:MAG: DUF4956 domain-containing protein [Bacilli bacterium]|nr:DUF4956 domain-containing protein [Bacilli bacterium]